MTTKTNVSTEMSEQELTQWVKEKKRQLSVSTLSLDQLMQLARELLAQGQIDLTDPRLHYCDGEQYSVAHHLAYLGYQFPPDSALLTLIDIKGVTVADEMALAQSKN